MRKDKLNNMVFYRLPSYGPCKVMVEYRGKFYDVRSGWGEKEGWTNDHVALPLSDEEIHSATYDGEEMSDEEIAELFDIDELAGICAAVKGQAGE